MATALTPYTPTTGTGITRLPDMISRLFDESFVMPSVFDRSFRQVLGNNLYETGDEYIVQVALPGVEADKVDIQVTGQQMMLKGSYAVPTPDGARVLWGGLASGDFTESISLQGEIEPDKAEARYEAGILTVTVSKAEHAKPKSIKVQTAR